MLLEEPVALAQNPPIGLHPVKIARIGLQHGPVKQGPAAGRRPLEQDQFIRGEEHWAQGSEELAQALHWLAIEQGCLPTLFQGNFNLVAKLAAADLTTQARCVHPGLDQFSGAGAAKTFQMAKQVDRFQQVGFALGIVAPDHIETRTPLQAGFSQVAKVPDRQLFQVHGR